MWFKTRRVPVPELTGRLVVITGAGSGIGAATAAAAAARGARLVLTDVDEQRLGTVAARLGSAVALSRPLDVSDVDAVLALAKDVHAEHGPADVVMNIAGIATWGAVELLAHEQWRRTIDVNLMGPIHLIEAFTPEMITGGRGGHLVNVSSAAGLVGLPWHAPYSASKFGLRGVSEVLRFDLRRQRIGVTLVCPGAVNTGLVETVDVAGVPASAREESGLNSLFRRHAIAPERVAEQILDAVVRNRYLVYTSPDIRALHAAERFAPGLYAIGMRLANAWFQHMMRRQLAVRP
ncbi:MAG: SDR family oxidoreductase [Actinomycetia bacterium]|nr:SDR family oxidoreductase [Actinomycetes bacterium]